MGKLDVVRTLLHHKADVNRCDKMGRTPTFLAAPSGMAPCLRLLLETKGNKINVPDNLGLTPLAVATKEDKLDCVELLLKHGAIVGSASVQVRGFSTETGVIFQKKEERKNDP